MRECMDEQTVKRLSKCYIVFVCKYMYMSIRTALSVSFLLLALLININEYNEKNFALLLSFIIVLI